MRARFDEAYDPFKVFLRLQRLDRISSKHADDTNHTMDSFTALGVAAAALQFFDFSRSLLREYKNQRGDTKALTQESFQNAIEDLLDCTERMKKAFSKTLGMAGWEEHEKVKFRSFHYSAPSGTGGQMCSHSEQ